MNPELTRQIAERLAARQPHEDLTPPDSLTVALPVTTVTAQGPNANGVTLSGVSGNLATGSWLPISAHLQTSAPGILEKPVDTLEGGLPAGQVAVLSAATSESKSSFQHEAPHANLALTPSTMEPQADAITFSSPEEEDFDRAETAVSGSTEELDAEFWKSVGVDNPDDLTFDKLQIVAKKLQAFQQNLRRSQREFPMTMGQTVHVKHRTPKKRKRKK